MDEKEFKHVFSKLLNFPESCFVPLENVIVDKVWNYFQFFHEEKS